MDRRGIDGPARLLLRLAVALSLSTSVADAQEASGSFHDAWYREVVLGDIRGAANQYYGLYAGTTADRARSGEAAKAAFRAGRCQEVLGELSLAEAAYRWLGERGWSQPTLQDRAAEWLRNLAARSGNSETESGNGVLGATEEGASLEPWSIDSSTLSSVSSPTLRGAIREAVLTARQRADRVRLLSEKVMELQRESRVRDQLLERLRERGLDLVFPKTLVRPGDAVVVGPGGGELAGRLEEALGDGGEMRALRNALADRLLDSALRSAAAGERETAASRAELTLALGSAHAGATELLEFLSDRLSDRALRALVVTRMELREAEATAGIRRLVRAHLRRAMEMVRDDHSLLELQEARKLVEVAPPHVLHDEEVAMLVEKLRHRYRNAGGESAEAILDALWRRARADAARLLDLGLSWTRLAWEEAVYSARPVWRSGVPAEEIVRRVLGELPPPVTEGAEGSAPSGRESPDRRSEYVKTWFPELEGRAR